MAILRIARIVEPTKDNRSYRGGLYHIYTDLTGDQPWAMFKTQLDLLKYENEMLQQGVSEEMIEKHRELVTDYEYDERPISNESST